MRTPSGAEPRDRVHDGGAAHASPEARRATLSELEVLQAISRAFGSSSDAEEAAEAAVRWVRAAVASEDARVRIFLARPDGGLAPALPRIEAADDPERLAERRRIFEGRRPTRFPVADGQVLVTFPLVSRGEAVGVLEVTAPADAVEERWATVGAVASQVAIVFRNLAHTSRLAAGLEGGRDMAGMASEIVRARTPEEAVKAAVRFCRERFRRPTAGWLSRGDPSRFELISARGLSRDSGRQLRSRMRVLRRVDLIDDDGRRQVAARFAGFAAVPEAEPAVAGDAVLVVGGPVADGHAPFRLVEGLLEDVLDHLGVVAAAERRQGVAPRILGNDVRMGVDDPAHSTRPTAFTTLAARRPGRRGARG